MNQQNGLGLTEILLKLSLWWQWVVYAKLFLGRGQARAPIGGFFCLSACLPVIVVAYREVRRVVSGIGTFMHIV